MNTPTTTIAWGLGRCSWAKLLVLVGLAGVLAGCSGREASVSGQVTFEGQPVTAGMVIFQPQQGGAAAYGPIQPDGSYQLATGSGLGLSAGEYVVLIDGTGEVPPEAASEAVEGEQMEATGHNPLPGQYADPKRSPLKATVQAGHQILNWPLTAEVDG